MPDLKGRVYVITGGSGAIAGAVAQAFAAAGARLALADVREQLLQERAQSLGALALGADLTDPGAAEAMVEQVTERLGRIDGLIHTVGGFAAGKVHEVDPGQYDRMFDLNVRTLFCAVRAVLPKLLARGEGFVAGFAAGPAWRGSGPGAALYAAAKSAVATFLRSLDAELSGTRIQVLIVYPMGVVDTPANRRAMPEGDPAGWIDPAAIADALVFAVTRGPRGRLVELPIHPPR